MIKPYQSKIFWAILFFLAAIGFFFSVGYMEKDEKPFYAGLLLMLPFVINITASAYEKLVKR